MAKTKGQGRAKKVLWAIFVVVFLLAEIAFAITTWIKLDRQTTTTTIGFEAYSVGSIDEKGEVVDSDSEIYLRKAVSAGGMTVEIEEGAKLTYKLFFYDKEDKLIGTTVDLEEDCEVETLAPEGTETARVLITPTDEEEEEISFLEMYEYVNRITVTVKR